MPRSRPHNSDDDSVDLEAHDLAGDHAHAVVRSIDLDVCPFCQKSVHAAADVCPHCRNFISFETEKHTWPTWVATLGLMLIVAALGVTVIVLLQRWLG